MKNQRKDRQNRKNGPATDDKKERRKKERRQFECEGYAYIEMVGWMDRRECIRREGSDC